MINTSSRAKTSVRTSSPTKTWLRDALQNNIVTTVLAMVLLIPLVTGTDMLNTRGKLVAFEGLGTVLLALTLGQARLRGAATRIKEALTSGPNLALLLLVAVAGVSWALSPYRAFASMEMMRIGFGVLIYFTLAYRLRGKGHLQTLTDGLLAVTAVASLFGLSQMSSSDAMLEGSFGSHELLGSFLMLMLPLALALGLTERGDSKRQIAAQGVALLAAACLLMARTRSAWIGGAFSLVALSILAWHYQTVAKSTQTNTARFFQQMRQRKHLVIGPVIILFGALALLILLSQTGGTLGQRLSTLASTGEDRSFQVRQAFWHGSLHMATARPIFGWGVGSYPVLESRFTGLGDAPAQVLAHGTSHSNIAHNFYLQTAAETGLVGLGLYLAAIALFFVTGIRAMWSMENGLRKAVLMGCLAAMAGQVVDAFGSPAYNFASVSLFQWVLMGLGMSAAGLGVQSPLTKREDAIATTSLGVSAPILRGLQYGVAGIAAIAIVSQIIPTITPAAAVDQICVTTLPPNNGPAPKITGPTTLAVPGETVTITNYVGTRLAMGTTFSTVYSRGSVPLAIVQTTPFSIKITRTAAVGSGSVLITPTFQGVSGRAIIIRFAQP